MTDLTTPRPRGLVPGSIEWLRELEGPRLVKRLVDEAHSAPIGEMTPTQARCAALLVERVLPTVSSVHHTVETQHAKLSDKELQERFSSLMEQHRMQIHLDGRESVEVDFSEEIKPETLETPVIRNPE